MKLYYYRSVGHLSAIAQFFDPEEAYCARGYLQSRGIDSIVQNEHHLTMVPWLRVALGGYRLLVISEFEEEARQALREVPAINTVEGAAAMQEPAKKNWAWLPVAFFSAVPFLPSRKTGLIGAFQFFILITVFAVFIIATMSRFIR